MTKPELVIWGASGHARVVANIIGLGGTYRIKGFLDDDPQRQHTSFCGATILGGRHELGVLRETGVQSLIVAVGHCPARLHLGDLGRAEGFDLATAVHPHAVLAGDVPIGVGTVIAAGAVINPGSTLGENVIVNTGAIVDHECRIDDGAHLSPGVRLAGRVQVGRMTWVGIGAVVKDRVRIGGGSIIGAGSLVLTDIPDGVVAYGVPARVIREVAAGDWQ
jgi:UDP-N-acetylbacillosamine N-acetyltransferase